MIPDGADLDRDIAAEALTEHAVAPGSPLELLNRSENSTYLLTDAATGERSVVRVHRGGYHEHRQIESELMWLDALSADGVVAVPRPLEAADGSRVVTVDVDGAPRHVVRFEWVAGSHPEEDALGAADFHELGRITAVLHGHSREWPKPSGFDRFAWNWHTCLGEAPRWGRWQDSAGVGAGERTVLDRAQSLLRDRLSEYGSGHDRFGLVHADLRLANLLVDDGNLTVIDFDDSGFSWFFYDFAAAVSFIEDDPALPQWQDAWLTGYRTVAPVNPADEEMLASLVLVRRLMLLAWMGTHDHALEAQTKLASYAKGSCDLAEGYLRSGGRTLG
ncbi:phosphotransferase enzyme family protein [Mycolicibacterium confluentis]|uniref:Aminoglycoside phosphotransferase n=1 Tax=Mycolicibacterium confluentis TaxID=28047 RepID=A0A7I7XRM5_9MYCO|nr:phosphotransferase [Mycolicibacterium confluentis]BBZ31860.1 aminoglycoside phosphotransferase [Mycolicibacterium confluentis]